MDTDVASNILRGRVSDRLRARLAGTTWCISFVTLGELTKWTILRSWGPRRLADLADWRRGVVLLPFAQTVATTWGEIQARAQLRAVLNTAVDDELIRRNPCRIKGAGLERAPERPTATVAQVFDLAARVPTRFRVLVLLAAFTSLRYGELAALRRRDIDPDRGTITVRATMIERQNGGLIFGPPKTDAGRRTVTIPATLLPEVTAHLAAYVADDPDALVFTGTKGAPLRRSNFQRTTAWTATVAAAGLPGFHFHDLRHTGNTLASRTGASLADLMARMGHASTRAALIYQHANQEQDQGIAAALSADIDRARNGHAGPTH